MLENAIFFVWWLPLLALLPWMLPPGLFPVKSLRLEPCQTLLKKREERQAEESTGGIVQDGGEGSGDVTIFMHWAPR